LTAPFGAVKLNDRFQEGFDQGSKTAMKAQSRQCTVCSNVRYRDDIRSAGMTAFGSEAVVQQIPRRNVHNWW
jgi:hypothetical protein